MRGAEHPGRSALRACADGEEGRAAQAGATPACAGHVSRRPAPSTRVVSRRRRVGGAVRAHEPRGTARRRTVGPLPSRRTKHRGRAGSHRRACGSVRVFALSEPNDRPPTLGVADTSVWDNDSEDASGCSPGDGRVRHRRRHGGVAPADGQDVPMRNTDAQRWTSEPATVRTRRLRVPRRATRNSSGVPPVTGIVAPHSTQVCSVGAAGVVGSGGSCIGLPFVGRKCRGPERRRVMRCWSPLRSVVEATQTAHKELRPADRRPEAPSRNVSKNY